MELRAGKKQNQIHPKENMKKTILTVAMLAGATVLVRAGDMDNIPGMNMPGMSDQAAQTNMPAAGTNAPVKPITASRPVKNWARWVSRSRPIIWGRKSSSAARIA
jgi:hypothetical protein